MSRAAEWARITATCVRALRRALVGEPLRLDAALTARYPALATAHWRAGGFPLRIGGWCLEQRSVAGITLGRTVFLAAGPRASVALMLHELGHVRQFERDKSFPMRYLWESVRHGYGGNPYEAEADKFAEEALWSGTPRRPS